jgi:3alpha(or 20beta)-hydroxysteroid dehydrogenase
MGRLSERVASVTGGAGGIGSAVARLLAAEEAAVIDVPRLDPDKSALRACDRRVRQTGGGVAAEP